MKNLYAVLILALCSVTAQAQTNINFSDTTPAPPSGYGNVHWQHDASSPVNISANFPLSWNLPIFVFSAPSGSCSPNNQVAYVTGGGSPYPQYICASGSWVQISGGSISGVSQIIAGTNVSISPGGGTGAVTISASGGSGASLAAYNPTSAIFFGDSITACAGVTTQSNCYPYQLASYLGLGGPTNYAVSGSQACDASVSVFNNDSPAIGAVQPWRSLLIGTNDANHESGSVPYEATFSACLNASLAWETIPVIFKAIGSAATTSGTCANDTTFSQVTGKNCTSNAATITFSLTTDGGTIYVWVRSIDSDAGTWTYAVDGGSPVSGTTALATPMNTQNGTTTAPVLLRITGISAGTHSIVFTKTTSSGNMPILAVGTAPYYIPGTSPYGTVGPTQPYIVAGVFPNQLNGNAWNYTGPYQNTMIADIALLQADGLGVFQAPVNVRVQATTAAADMADTIHPNDNGHKYEIYPAFQTAVKVIPALAASTPQVNIWATNYQTTNYTVTQSDGTVFVACPSACTITYPTLTSGTIIGVVNLSTGGTHVNIAGTTVGPALLTNYGQSVYFQKYPAEWIETTFSVPSLNMGAVSTGLNSSYTVQASDGVVNEACTSSCTVTLPINLGIGQVVSIVESGSATLTIGAGSGATISGGPSTLTTGQAATFQLQSNQTTWLNIGSNIGTGSGSGPTIQTNGANNGSQSILNFETSTANAVGLVVTPVYSATGVEKMEISGNYSGIASGSGYAIPFYGSGASQAIAPSNITSDSTGNNLIVPGSISSAPISGDAGILSLASNTTNPALLTQRFNLLGAPLAPGSVTAFAWQVPTATNSSAGILHVGAESSNVSQLSVSLIAIADLSATGTPSSTTFLRGDNTWATPSATGVTSIATTSPITGGTITSTGTIACATCVVASSPGVGVAHFAGSTQTVTSSLIVAADITNATITGTQIASSVALAGSPTTTTQTAGDDSTKIATTAYTNTQYTLIKTSGSPFTMTAITGFYWADSGSNYSWDLPTPQAGLQLCFGQGLDNSNTISLIPGSGVTITYLGTQGTAGSSTGLVSGGTGADFICLVGYNSTNYYAIGAGVGTWTNH